MEQVSVFVEYFGSSPLIGIMDFLIVGKDFEYSKREIVEGAGVGRTSFRRAWKRLVAKRVVVSTRTRSKTKRFKLNMTDLIVKKLVKFDWEITKVETDKFLSKRVKIKSVD